MRSKQSLINMSLGSAMHEAVALSGMSRDDISTIMGWPLTRGSRYFNPNENYWPSMPNIPRLCEVLGNDLLIEWMRANIGMNFDSIPELTPAQLMQRLVTLSKELGDVAQAGQESIADDDNIDAMETKRLIKELGELMSAGQSLLTQLHKHRESLR